MLLNISKYTNRLGQRLFAPIRPEIVRSRISCLRNQDVLVLGSGPNPDLSWIKGDYKLVTCNGSAANAKRLGLPDPALTVINSELISPEKSISKPGRVEIVQNCMLRNLNLGIIFIGQSSGCTGGEPEILKCKYDNFFRFNEYEMRYIFDNASHINLLNRKPHLSLCSTGAMAIASAVFLGAKSVKLAGFSFLKSNSNSKTHFYEVEQKNDAFDTGLDTRNHSAADSLLISALAVRGFKVETREPELLQLVQNWGSKGPKF